MDGDFSFMDKWLAAQSAFTAYDEIPYDQLLGRDSLQGVRGGGEVLLPKMFNLVNPHLDQRLLDPQHSLKDPHLLQRL